MAKLKDLKRKLLKNPEVRAEYEALTRERQPSERLRNARRPNRGPSGQARG